MQVKRSAITKFKITQTPLDPISVYLEDFGVGQGEITINCYGKSWTSYWGHMGKDTISDFFIRADNHYLAKNLEPVFDCSTVYDKDAIACAIKNYYGEDEQWDAEREIESMEIDVPRWLYETEAAEKIYGEEPWNAEIPRMENPRYTYLCRIIEVVRDALRAEKERQESAANRRMEVTR